MIIREAIETEKAEIVALYRSSQIATGIPSPELVPSSELGAKLYQRDAIKRYISIEDHRIIGHGIIEEPNPDHLSDWQQAVNNYDATFIELGAAFVDPSKFGRGIWSSLLTHRLHVVRSLGAIPVSVTWTSNLHVRKHFEKNGGTEITQKETRAGNISLFLL